MKRIVLCLIMFLMFIPGTKAYTCNESDKNRLQKLANNITVNVDGKVNEYGNPYFTVTLVGVSNELSIDTDATLSSVSLQESGFKEFTYVVYETNKTYSFLIEGNQNVCWFKILRTITVNTPYFNKYYNDPVCDTARNYSLCQKWTKANMSYEEFVQKVQEYKNNSNITEQNPNNPNNDFDFFDFYEKYYWPSVISLIVILTLLILLWVKESNKNKF